MQFLPEDKKKRARSVVLLVVFVVAILYVNVFLRGDSSSAPVVIDLSDVEVPDETGGGDLGGGAADTPLSTIPRSRSGSRLLPYGSVIDGTVLEDERFLELQKSPELILSEEELGKENLFNL